MDAIFATAGTAVGTLATNVTTLLVAFSVIPLAFVGYKMYKRAMGRG